jgi:hypothetical protein
MTVSFLPCWRCAILIRWPKIGCRNPILVIVADRGFLNAGSNHSGVCLELDNFDKCAKGIGTHPAEEFAVRW